MTGSSNASTNLLSLTGITKHFGPMQALADITLDFKVGEIHAVLGENGAGKSTLMHVLAGLLRPDAGRISVGGRPLPLASPSAARRAGIGMVHQHFTLVEQLTVAENLVLSLPSAGRFRLSAARSERQAETIAQDLGLEIGNPRALCGTLPVGTRQQIEIAKALAANARILILDEPTAVLTRDEVRRLFLMLQRLRDKGRLILFITHKLREVIALADRVTVMRRGRVIATRSIGELTEASIAALMIGAPAPAKRPQQPVAFDAPERLRVEDLSTPPVGGCPLRKVSLSIRAGETFGVAGVSGNGQEELFESLVGLRTSTTGTILLNERPLTRINLAARSAAGLGHIPPDRQRDGLVLPMSVAENAVLHPAVLNGLRHGMLLPPRHVNGFAADLVQRHAMRVKNIDAPAATLSGGNQQRLVVARQLAPRPAVLVAFNPTRGLDVAAAQSVYDALTSFVAGGSALLLISNDLEEIFDLSHRLAVLFEGRLSEALIPPVAPDLIGRLMAGTWS